MQPGEYLVGINLARAPSPGTPYPPTYYPGTPKRDEATAITVGAGVVLDGIKMVLPAPMQQGQIDIRILTATGRGKASVCASPIAGGAGGIYPEREPGGGVTIAVVAGVRYRMVAHVDRPDGDVESEVVEVTAKAGRQAVTLRATTPAKPHPIEDACYPLYVR